MKDIIKKAIEGGWQGKWEHIEKNFDFRQRQSIFCDPLFWQALGKACKWHETGITTFFGNSKWQKDLKRYECVALLFHEINLTEGWDKAVSYLNEVIK